MKTWSFGQHENGIIQAAYTVTDIETEMRRWSETLGVGPWFIVGPFVPVKGIYRGELTTMSISLAVAFAGEIMVELIEQYDEKPSVYRETLQACGAHGFHHWAIGARDFDDKMAELKAKGYEEVFSDLSPRGVRIAYVDTSVDLPGMLEVIEMTPDVEAQYQKMQDAAKSWDGTFQVHRIQPVKKQHPVDP